MREPSLWWHPHSATLQVDSLSFFLGCFSEIDENERLIFPHGLGLPILFVVILILRAGFVILKG